MQQMQGKQTGRTPLAIDHVARSRKRSFAANIRRCSRQRAKRSARRQHGVRDRIRIGLDHAAGMIRSRGRCCTRLVSVCVCCLTLAMRTGILPMDVSRQGVARTCVQYMWQAACQQKQCSQYGDSGAHHTIRCQCRETPQVSRQSTARTASCSDWPGAQANPLRRYGMTRVA